MSILTRARFGLARLLLKSSGLTYMPGWIRSSFLTPSFQLLVSEGYSKNAIVSACIGALAFTFPEPPLLVYADDDPQGPPLPNHPLRRLVQKPNLIMGEDELWAYTIAYMGIGGNAYWLGPLNARGLPVELWPYHAGQVRPIPGGDSWITGYEFLQGDGTWKALNPREYLVCHFKWPLPDPQQPWMAQPPLRAASRAVDSDLELDRYLYALLKNDAMPRTVVSQSTERFMTPDEVLRAKAQFKANYSGDNAGDVLILEAGAKVERLSLNMEELAFDALRRVPEQRIAAALRVPLSVAGIGDDPTYANSQEAYSRFTRSTLVPLWRAAAAEVTAELGAVFGVVARHDLNEVAALQEDVNAKWARVNTAFNSGFISFQESRAALGFGAVDTADLFVMPTTRTLQPAALVLGQEKALTAPSSTPILGYHIESGVVSRNEARAQLGLAPEDETLDDKLRRLQGQLAVASAAVNVGIDTNQALKLVGIDLTVPPPILLPPLQLTDGKSTKARRTARTAQTLQRIRGKVANQLAGALDEWFSDLAERVVDRVGKSKQAKALPGLDELIAADDFLRLETLIKRYGVEVVRASWETWNTALDLDISFELTDPAVVAAQAEAGKRIKDISTTTLDAVRAALTYGAEQGWTLSQLVSGDETQPGLRALIEETYKGRAKACARTEMAFAQNAATHARYEAAGVEKVEVFDGGADDSDDVCNQLNGSIQTLAWAKANPLQHPNCTRCFSPSFSSNE